MSTITGVHHIAIRATDFDRTMRFYNDTLGLATKASWTRDTGRAALVEIASGSYMEIFERAPTEYSGTAPILHFCFRTDDVDGMTERARAAGHRVITEPLSLDIDTSIGPMKLRLAFVEGPDGEEIELMASDPV